MAKNDQDALGPMTRRGRSDGGAHEACSNVREKVDPVALVFRALLLTSVTPPSSALYSVGLSKPRSSPLTVASDSVAFEKVGKGTCPVSRS